MEKSDPDLNPDDGGGGAWGATVGAVGGGLIGGIAGGVSGGPEGALFGAGIGLIAGGLAGHFIVRRLRTLETKTRRRLVRHFECDLYHDRFWIADEQRGLFVGTSLNGIGLRYSLVDLLNSSDLAEIVVDLRQRGIS